MIESIKQWFKVAIPKPTDKQRAVQVGVHFEEVGEMAESIGEAWLENGLQETARYYKTSAEIGRQVTLHADRRALLDSLCDQIVTAVGVAHMFNLDLAGALAEVDRANWSKFVDGQPVFDANGKIAKGPNYSPPDLTSYL